MKLSFRHGLTQLLVALALLIAVGSPNKSRAADPSAVPERVQLDNGVTLLLGPLKEAKVVAVEMFYPVGFVDEPERMTQSTHLLEHLMCQGETRSYRPGESFSLIRGMGMANAETLPTFTHFDYVAPPSELGTIFKIESERLETLHITSDVVDEEIDKCKEETSFVQANPQSGMLKHAMMALCQFWRHDAREVRVRRGLEDISVEKLETLHRELYRPDELIVAVVGNFEKSEAIELAKKHLGPLKSPDRSKRNAVNWPAVSSAASVVWDVEMHAVCIAAPPPESAEDRIIISLWGTLLAQRLSMDAEIKGVSHMVFSSNTTWPVGRIPFFVYAAATSEENVPKLRELIAKRLAETVTTFPATDGMQVRMLAAQYSGPPVPSWSEVQKQAATLAKTIGQDAESVTSMVLGNLALQWGLREMFGLGGSGAKLSSESLTDERIAKVVRETLEASRLRVVTLSPPKGPEGE